MPGMEDSERREMDESKNQTTDLDDCISRQAAIYVASGYCHPSNVAKELADLPSVNSDLIQKIEEGIKATTPTDEYMVGMRNGMRWCKSLLDGKEPKYDIVQPNHNAEPGKMVDDCISRQEAIDAVLNVIPHDEYWAEQVEKAIRSLPPVQQEITHEQAVDYLHKTGWLQNHDRILTESKVPLKGIWKDFTDEGYVECPFCKSATNCESKEEIDDLHFCFSCGAMLKRGKAE